MPLRCGLRGQCRAACRVRFGHSPYDGRQLRRRTARQLAVQRRAIVVHLESACCDEVLLHCAFEHTGGRIQQAGWPKRRSRWGHSYAPVLPTNQAKAQVCSLASCNCLNRSGIRIPRAGKMRSPASVTAMVPSETVLTARAASAFRGAAESGVARRGSVRSQGTNGCHGEARAAHAPRTWRVVRAHHLQVREARFQLALDRQVRPPVPVHCQHGKISRHASDVPVGSAGAERDVHLAAAAKRVHRSGRLWARTATVRGWRKVAPLCPHAPDRPAAYRRRRAAQ